MMGFIFHILVQTFQSVVIENVTISLSEYEFYGGDAQFVC